MSFNVFAAGVPNFNYERSNCPDEDIFEAATVASALRSFNPSAAGVASAAGEYVTPNSTLGAINALATLQFLRLMKMSVDFLALRPRARNGWISVAPRVSHIIWPDTVGFAKFEFRHSSDPGTDFFNTIKDALVETDMNNYGVLRIIALVLSRYNDHISNSDHVMIQIQLSK